MVLDRNLKWHILVKLLQRERIYELSATRAALLWTGFAGKLWPTQLRRFSDEFLT
jgi:hypothetical protein